MQIAELLINNTYMFEVSVPLKSRIPIVCTSALIYRKNSILSSNLAYFLSLSFKNIACKQNFKAK